MLMFDGFAEETLTVQRLEVRLGQAAATLPGSWPQSYSLLLSKQVWVLNCGPRGAAGVVQAAR